MSAGNYMYNEAENTPTSLLPSMMEAPHGTEQRQQDLPRPYKCPLCVKAFHRLEHQTRHIRTHTGEKPHRCSFPGCIKRFSRSDELTRHLRIHNNPNSRRSSKIHQTLLNTSVMGEGDMHLPAMITIMPPPTKNVSRSAPVSTVASPNISPPPSHSSYVRAISTGIKPLEKCTGFHAQFNKTTAKDASHQDINILASAASQVERDGYMTTQQPTRNYRLFYNHSNPNSRSHLPSLSSYSSSRTHALDRDDYHSHRLVKRSRPNSPNSTAPSSPTFSHDSLSPTPDHTPLVTPAHSPRLRSHGSGYDLPSLRNLSLYPPQLSTLAPMEPPNNKCVHHSSPFNKVPCRQPLPKTGLSLSDIILQADGTQRKLPCPQFPKVSVHDFLCPSEGGFHNMPSSASGPGLLSRVS